MGATAAGTPIYLKDVANVQLGPEIRRGAAELDGKGEVAGGIVIVRFGENVLNVIDRVKEKIRTDIAPSLPPGVKIVTTYDRSDLINRSMATLKDEIVKLAIAVSVVCIVFLFHLPSALVVILTLPVAIIMSFILMFYLGVTSNIMSLSGIAIAIGAMVDASIIMVENAHKKLEEWEEAAGRGMRAGDERGTGRGEVGGPRCHEQDGRHHRGGKRGGPVPVLLPPRHHGRLPPGLYAPGPGGEALQAPGLHEDLRHALLVLPRRDPDARPDDPLYQGADKVRGEQPREPLPPLGLRAGCELCPALQGDRHRCRRSSYSSLTYIPYSRLGSEFMPPLYEGTLFYMPVTAPAASISVATDLLQLQDKILKGIPEVESVFGKAGRAETATDPAPLEMFETVVNLKPESANGGRA